MRNFWMGTFLCGLAACASARGSGVDATVKRSRVDLGWHEGSLRFDVDAELSASSDTVFLSARAAWETLPQSFARYELAVGGIDTAGRVLRSQVRVRRVLGGVRLSRIINCGSGAGGSKAEIYNVFLTVMTRVDSLSTVSSVLRTLVTATAHDPTVVGNRVECSSTGWLEPRLADEVQAGRE